uniref:helix-turn-helix transcriptional regulator n=1 Tax=Nocardia grenadensis TaxID=931537 RepID=UPI0012EDEAF7
MDGKVLGERIAAARKDRNLTQDHLASRVGIERTALGRIEMGERKGVRSRTRGPGGSPRNPTGRVRARPAACSGRPPLRSGADARVHRAAGSWVGSVLR